MRIVLILALLAGALYGGKKIVDAVRGIRNNNPGNIRDDGTAWMGRVSAERQTDPDFVQFIKPEYGIRALSRVLDSYANRGIVTVRSIIATFAPPGENDTGAYQNAVARMMNVPLDQRLGPGNRPALVAAIIQHENGIQPYDASTIANGIALA